MSKVKAICESLRVLTAAAIVLPATVMLAVGTALWPGEVKISFGDSSRKDNNTIEETQKEN